jgi:alpha-tubulin suppressor-like RCC1 family protein
LATQSSTPVKVLGGVAFASVQAGTNNLACGLAIDGAVYCWGLNWRGEVGSSTNEFCGNPNASIECASSPVRVRTSGGSTFRDVAAGNSYACGVLDNGAMYCWGRNGDGQLGVEAGNDCATSGAPDPCLREPVLVPGGHRFITVSAGDGHTCGNTEEGPVVCWGRNRFGELGNGSLATTRNSPEVVRGGLTFVSVSAGRHHTCGATRSGTLYCWGINDFGQLGDGTDHIGLEPVAVTDPL